MTTTNERPQTGLLAADTGMGAVTLRVGDLDGMIRYYRDGVTLELLRHDGPVAVLGRGATPVVILEHAPDLRQASPRDAGLYHTAILFDSREALAAAISSVASKHPGTFTGSADHLVSEAFYFTDPEGNGVELYFDRDRSTWSWTHGRIEMATIFLDPNTYLREHLARVEQDRGVEQPGAARRRVLQLGGVLEDHDRRGAASEHGDGAVVAQQLEGDAVAVVADHGVEVGDPQRHRAHAGVGGEEPARREVIGCSHN